MSYRRHVCRRGLLSRSRSDVSSLIRSNYGAVREHERVYRAAGHLPGQFTWHRSDSQIQPVAVGNTAQARTCTPFPIATRIGVSRLWPSGNGSLNLSRKRHECSAVSGVAQYQAQGRRKGESAGRTLETPSSTCDLIVDDQGGVTDTT